MEKLKWQADKGKLVECLAVDAARSMQIEEKVKFLISANKNMFDTINEVREFCTSEEEFTSFIFALGFYQGTVMPFGFKMT